MGKQGHNVNDNVKTNVRENNVNDNVRHKKQARAQFGTLSAT